MPARGEYPFFLLQYKFAFFQGAAKTFEYLLAGLAVASICSALSVALYLKFIFFREAEKRNSFFKGFRRFFKFFG